MRYRLDMTAPNAKKKRPAIKIQNTVLRRNFAIFHHSRCVGDGVGVGGAEVGGAVVGGAVVGSTVVGGEVVGVAVGAGVGEIVVAFADGATVGDTVVSFPCECT